MQLSISVIICSTINKFIVAMKMRARLHVHTGFLFIFGIYSSKQKYPTEQLFSLFMVCTGRAIGSDFCTFLQLIMLKRNQSTILQFVKIPD